MSDLTANNVLAGCRMNEKLKYVFVHSAASLEVCIFALNYKLEVLNPFSVQTECSALPALYRQKVIRQ